MADAELVAPVGVDIGTVRTKVAVGNSMARDVPTPPALWHNDRIDGSALRALVTAARSAVAHRSGRSELVVAVPDQWMVGPDAEPLAAVEASPQAERLVAALRTEFDVVQPVSRSACLAAFVEDFADGVGLVCDVGARTVAAAAFVRDGDTVRVFDVESTVIGDVEPTALMLTVPSSRQVTALHAERVERHWRATRVLARAVASPAYRSTPIYLAGAHGGSIDAATVAAALQPVAAAAADVVARLLDRISVPRSVELILTGGNALGPVVAAVRSVVADVRQVVPGAVALGAARIASGAVRVIGAYPHAVGVVTHRVTHGLLEQLVLTAPVSERTAIALECIEAYEVSSVVRVRPGQQGPWLESATETPISVAPGRYAVFVETRCSPYGALRLRDNDSGDVMTVLVDPTRRLQPR
ncbi:hypothetical protein [Nocardia sp. NPDC058705]|uniref:hypothetical protein n=1 Tax=Nocardia sp. NPDC058705 TaxID=3346609 RepID=UPI0036B839AF